MPVTPIAFFYQRPLTTFRSGASSFSRPMPEVPISPCHSARLGCPTCLYNLTTLTTLTLRVQNFP